MLLCHRSKQRSPMWAFQECWRETPSGVNGWISASADHLHAQIPILHTQKGNTPKSIIGHADAHALWVQNPDHTDILVLKSGHFWLPVSLSNVHRNEPMGRPHLQCCIHLSYIQALFPQPIMQMLPLRLTVLQLFSFHHLAKIIRHHWIKKPAL